MLTFSFTFAITRRYVTMLWIWFLYLWLVVSNPRMLCQDQSCTKCTMTGKLIPFTLFGRRYVLSIIIIFSVTGRTRDLVFFLEHYQYIICKVEIYFVVPNAMWIQDQVLNHHCNHLYTLNYFTCKIRKLFLFFLFRGWFLIKFLASSFWDKWTSWWTTIAHFVDFVKGESWFALFISSSHLSITLNIYKKLSWCWQRARRV